jgi:hypothetical protein
LEAILPDKDGRFYAPDSVLLLHPARQQTVQMRGAWRNQQLRSPARVIGRG